MLSTIKRYVPRSVKAAMRRILRSLRRPELGYLELHLTDHCDLNCRGCGHFCPLAPPHYADIGQYKTDMRRLSQLFSNIRRIRLMGGEPLLHPDPASFMLVTRAAFPRSDIHFVTNGILLPRASADFWDACRTTGATIDLTVYPPVEHRVEELRVLCEAEHVPVRVTIKRTFEAQLNLKGDSDKQKAFRLCRDRFFCPFLQEGRLYVCSNPALVHYFNSFFGTRIEAGNGIDIHSRSISGREILRRLNQPAETCRWCSYKPGSFSWSASHRNITEWDEAEQRQGGSIGRPG